MKKHILFLILTSLLSLPIVAQELPQYPDSLFPPYYHQRATQFEDLPKFEDQIVFLGNSITDGGNWSELFQDDKIINRGISGDITTGVLNRLKEVVERKPKKVFLLIGTNDLARGVEKDSVLTNIDQIVSLIQYHSPSTDVYVQSIFPVNKEPGNFEGHAKNKEEINDINRALKEKSDQNNYTYLDVFSVLKNEDGAMNLKYSNDGLHLTGAGYQVWKHFIYPHVYDLQEKPSIIPKPQELEWKKEKFALYKQPGILVKDDTLKGAAKSLKKLLKEKGIQSVISDEKKENTRVIELQLGKVDADHLPEEAYTLEVTEQKINITGNTAEGVFHGVQTLRQLMRDGVYINAVSIKDWPAFSWRGYMVDVGRNYQSIERLKEQIDEMAHYKLNKFHFHPTEDVAWRLQIEQYPELTDQEFMTRDKGQYYTIDEVHDLIDYAKERFITLVPEIDMPGHSEAFERAMGVDMQSEEGLDIVKNILREVDSTYDVPYIHIGADEVEITNEKFIPEVVDLIHKDGKETIGWAPGGNYDDRTIRQLWKDEQPEKDKSIKYIDSRDLYTNHMDPLNGVLSIFNRKFGDVDKENEEILGAEIALWNDNRAGSEEDILQMNFAYPSMLTFAERSWRGGGTKGFLTDMGAKTSQRHKDFKKFEQRLIDQKKLYFQNKSFPYQPQADIEWALFGPFDNDGDLERTFWPEENLKTLKDSIADEKAYGGTVWLRHFFEPLVESTLEEPEENSTWYAYREIYSPEDTTGKFWISFDNSSRSYVVSTPERGTWDDRESKVWINGELVAPPKWTYPGREGSTEDPIVDESYESRPPTEVRLKKGWNKILIKAPVGTFQGRSWQHPVKWMFTLIRVEE